LNADIQIALGDAERALERNDHAAAIASFIEAGDAAVGYQLWRSATRAFRSALEVDVVARAPIERLVGLGNRLRTAADWIAYGIALDEHPEWPHFGARHAQIRIDDRNAHVECAGVGVVLHLAMPAVDRVEVGSDPKLDGMPRAMALVILRRALWPNVREQTGAPMRVTVGFGGVDVVLDELGDWG
jgi:hypothetical protein